MTEQTKPQLTENEPNNGTETRPEVDLSHKGLLIAKARYYEEQTRLALAAFNEQLAKMCREVRERGK